MIPKRIRQEISKIMSRYENLSLMRQIFNQFIIETTRNPQRRNAVAESNERTPLLNMAESNV
jgi:hypothetical protein